MRKNHIIGITAFAALASLALSCVKDHVAETTTPLPQGTVPGSFVEEFDSVSALPAKGWVFRNNSFPVGAGGWRQGRYEPSTGAQYKFGGPVPFYGFPAYSARLTPNDFISADITTVGGTGSISTWLISPALPMRNGDQIVFFTRAVDDSNYPIFTKDRMQVWANFTDGTANVGADTASTGSFNRMLLDINPTYVNNDPGGYPRDWRKYTITLNNIPGGVVTNGRFAFRYRGWTAGLQGPNYPSVVGIDSLAFINR
ncbi:choice-of-anchor J domain-containing protein [Flaviaesturariibacter amylovorans]|uniref:DUF4465 domain-containing protein n=1 Tax=Flaviaesturariibacter amylovorans TaxID=1084520 RepID=A0ABP8H0X9_9BACT